jgi:dTDP-4-amino-4,6-dideoxygalactose transaminase
LDAIQAAILTEKLKQLDNYISARQQAAAFYDTELAGLPQVQIPKRNPASTHVFHQYTLKVPVAERNGLIAYLKGKGIPSMVYYPIPLSEQLAYKNTGRVVGNLDVTKELCQQVISLPMHTELDHKTLKFITDTVKEYFTNN